MRKFLFAILSVMLAICLASSNFVIASDDRLVANEVIGNEVKVYSNATVEDDFADDRVLVVLTNPVSITKSGHVADDFPELACREVRNLTEEMTKIVQAKVKGNISAEVAALREDAADLTVVDRFDANQFNQILCLELEQTGKDKVIEAISLLEKRNDILYVGPDYAITAFSTTPNDPFYSDQWAASKIQLPQAWDSNTGSATVYVGVIDTGIDGSHPDLASKINVSYSRDCTSGSPVAVSSVTDPNGHGTQVAGIIAATGNNSIGISGVAWGTRLASYRVFDEYGSGYSSSVIAAVNFAGAIGIPILNFSGGWWKTGNPQEYDKSLDTVIRNYPGLFVCAAGNDSFNLDDDYYDVYPAKIRLSNLISVGASTSSDTKLGKSNYGKTTVDIFAPGEEILTCYPLAKCTGGVHNLGSDHYLNGYHYFEQTSSAAPHVAGVAALILSKYPGITAAHIKQKIMASVNSISSLSNYCVSGGRLNAYKAINYHAFSYTSNNATTHTGVCFCGHTVTESHSWETISTADVGSNVLVRVCTKCGYRDTP